MMIRIYHADHHPPHMHVQYGEMNVIVTIDSGEILAGTLPPRLMRLLNEWRKIHKAGLKRAWEDAQALKPLKKIKPLE